MTDFTKKKKKTIGFNFFQIVPDDKKKLTSVDISEQLRLIPTTAFKDKVNRDGSKTISLHGDPEDMGGYYIMSILDSKMENIDPKWNRKTRKLSPLPLDDDDGLPKCYSLLIDPQINMMMVEGYSPSKYLKFLKNNLKLSATVTSLVLDPQELYKLSNMISIDEVEIKIAKVQDLMESDSRKSVKEFIDVADGTNTDTLKIGYGISAENKKNHKSLSKSAIIQKIKNLISANSNEEVKSIQVKGKYNESGKQFPIQLINQRLKAEIETEEEVRKVLADFPLARRRDKMREVYEKFRPDLLSVYSLEKV